MAKTPALKPLWSCPAIKSGVGRRDDGGRRWCRPTDGSVMTVSASQYLPSAHEHQHTYRIHSAPCGFAISAIMAFCKTWILLKLPWTLPLT